jgi:general secretion pathway protein G
MGFTRRRAAGFTLIELMIVMVLMVLLASIVLAVYGNSVARSREAVLREDLFQMRKAIDEYYADKSAYPPSLESLVTEGYLRSIPTDPVTGSAETWHTTASEFESDNPAAVPGISDVHSGSAETGLDGTAHAEWE